MEENNIKNDEIRDQSIIDTAEDTGSLFKKLLPLLFALVLAILLFVFFNKSTNVNETEIQATSNDKAIDSLSSNVIDSTIVVSDSTIIDSAK